MDNILNYEFIQNALLAAIMLSFVLPFVGVIVLLRRMTFIADSLGHVNMSGIAFTIFISSIIPSLVNVSFLIVIIWTIISALAIEYLRDKYKSYKEISITIVYTLAVALTMIFLSFSGGYKQSIFNILFGNINAISREQVYFIILFTIIILIFFKYNFKKLIIFSLEEEYVKMYGYNVNFLKYSSIIIVALTITLAIKIIGVLLVSSLITIPLLASSNLTNSLKKTINYCIIINLIIMVSGIFISYYFDISASAVIVLFSLFIYLFTLKSKKTKI